MRARDLSRLVVFGVAFPVLAGGLSATTFAERFSLRVSPMAMLSMGGSFDDTQKLNAVVDLGGGPTAGLRFELNNNIYLDAGYGYFVLPVKAGLAPWDFRHDHSYFDIGAATLNVSIYRKSGFIVEPYLTFGGGLYNWSFRNALVGGKAWPSPALPQRTFAGMSPGINFGFGGELNMFLHLTMIAEFRYTYIYSRNIQRLGTDDFNQQDFFCLSVGLIYYFSRR